MPLNWLAAALLTLQAGDTLWIPAGTHADPVRALPDSVALVASSPDARLTGGVWLDHERGVSLIGLEISGTDGRALTFTGTSADLSVLGCRITGPSDSGPVSPHTALAGVSVPDVLIQDCVFHDGPGHGLYAMAMPSGGPGGGPRIPDRFVLRRSSFWNLGGWAIHANNEGNGLQPTDLLVENCRVWNCGGGLVFAMGNRPVARDLFVANCRTGVWLGYEPSRGARLERPLVTGCYVGLLVGDVAAHPVVVDGHFVGNRIDQIWP